MLAFGILREGNFQWGPVESYITARIGEVKYDGSLSGRQHSRTGSELELQSFVLIIPCHLNSHPFAFAIVEGRAVVFVEQERRVSAGVNRDRERFLYRLIEVLLHGIEWENRPSAYNEPPSASIFRPPRLASVSQWPIPVFLFRLPRHRRNRPSR